MALDPNILLQGGTTPNIMDALTRGLAAGQAIKQAPILAEIQKEKLRQVQEQTRMAPILAEQERIRFDQEQALQTRLADIKEKELQFKEQSLLSQGAEVGDKNLLKIREEVRSSVGKEVSNIKSDASSIEANFNKIKNLTAQVKKGNRTAVSQALVSLVKLGDPGSIVNESEMKAALNAQNPVAAITGLLSGKGVSDEITQSIASKIDPLNPTNINVNDLLGTANALVQSNVPALQSRFESERERATENLTPEGFKSLFNKRTIDGIGKLSDLRLSLEDEQPPVDSVPTGTIKNNDGSFTFSNGKRGIDNGDGTFTLETGERIRRSRGNP